MKLNEKCMKFCSREQAKSRKQSQETDMDEDDILELNENTEINNENTEIKMKENTYQ